MNKPKRLVRFALQADDSVDVDDLRKRIDICLATKTGRFLSDLLPVGDHFWDFHAKVGRRWSDLVEPRADHDDPPYLVDRATVAFRRKEVDEGRPPGIAFKLAPFLPATMRHPPKLAPELAKYNFLILTLPLYEADHKRTQCNPRGALFDVAYILKFHCKLASVTPSIPYSGFELLSGDKGKGGDDSTGGRRACPARTDDVAWHLENIGFGAVPDHVRGSGVVVGHPDTGWTPHSELNFSDGANGSISPNFVAGTDLNVLDPNVASGGRELVPSPPSQIPLTRTRYHGTLTAGLIVSDDVTGGGAGANDRVRGLATEATIVSIRCVDTVILIDGIDVANAILAAIEAQVHVISISLGGTSLPVLAYAVHLAVANNIIVVAAAGNYVKVVVHPAAYPVCIAAGGSTISDSVWDGSARNWGLASPIDISAPAECVWSPFWTEAGRETASRNSGTSFATAIVAGAAAIWLQNYNRDSLITQLDSRVPLQELFRAHLAATARRPAGWDVILDGPGILDFRGLMNRRTLPNPRTFGSIGYALDVIADEGSSFGRRTQDLFEDTLGKTSEFANEVGTIIMTNPIVGAMAQGIEATIAAGEDLAADAAAQGEDIKDDLKEIAEGVADAVEELVNEVAEAASEAASSAAKATSNAAKKVLGWFGQ